MPGRAKSLWGAVKSFGSASKDWGKKQGGRIGRASSAALKYKSEKQGFLSKSMDLGTKGVTLAAFGPIAAVGWPVLKTGQFGAKKAWGGAKIITEQAGKSLTATLGTSGGRKALAVAGLGTGAGMMLRGESQRTIDRQEQRIQHSRTSYRDRTLALSQSLHTSYNRNFTHGLSH